MTKIAVLQDRRAGEHRVAMTPAVLGRLTKLGAEVLVEHDAGARARIADEDYAGKGARMVGREEALAQADLLLTVTPPDPADLAGIRAGAILLGGLQPFADPARLRAYGGLRITALALELLPRTTRAQAMDILSSQANLAGYRAVLEAATTLNRCLPMMTTAAGTVPAAKLFVMGVGVAGLQAIATGRRLGAIASATDVRPETREQIMSLGAKPIFVEIGEGDQLSAAAGGYAGEMSDAYRARQAELVTTHVSAQDIVITTALLQGRPAPRLISDAQLSAMRPGSVIVDLAVEAGGNVEGAELGRTVERHGVLVIGAADGASRLAADASNLFARNLATFTESYWDKGEGRLHLPDGDALVDAVRLTSDGRVVHPRFAETPVPTEVRA